MTRNLALAAAIALVALACASLPAAQGQAAQTGTVELIAQVTPTAGRPEPVRQITFYLLRKSFADIQKEAEESEPKPDLDLFIEGLEVSKELKAWMKKKHMVELAGSGFTGRLTVDDIFEVPEFYDAYLKRNSGGAAIGFPKPKYRSQDARENPEKYKREVEEYRKQLRRYIEANPQSIEEIDAQLEAINPGPRWAQQQSDQRRRGRRRTLQLAQTRHLVAKTDTDLEGRGTLTGIPPGEYWLSTLETEAVAGDARLRWDVPVTVRASQTTRIELSNLNAIEPQRAGQ
jgi:hypothetical protein